MQNHRSCLGNSRVRLSFPSQLALYAGKKMNHKRIITPYFDGVLKGLDEEASKIQSQSLIQINGNPRLSDFVSLVDSSLQTIAGINFEYETQIENEKTIQYLGCRIFNSGFAALKLGIIGFYQIGFNQIRDLVETGFLLDYFSFHPDMIQIWRESNLETRMKKFSPKNIRIELDKRDEFHEKRRGKIYQALCEFATHSNYAGFTLISQDNFVKIGPFFDQNYLTGLLEEIILRLPIVVLYFLENFKNLPTSTLELRHDFLLKLESIQTGYLKRQPNSKIHEISDLLDYAKEMNYL